MAVDGVEGNTENGEYGAEVAEGCGVIGWLFRKPDAFAAAAVRKRLADDDAECSGAVRFSDREEGARAEHWGSDKELQIVAGSDSAESIMYSSSASVSQRCQDGIRTSSRRALEYIGPIEASSTQAVSLRIAWGENMELG